MKELVSKSKSGIFNQIILPGIVATACMTCYSYVMARRKNENFREPQVLNFLIYGKGKVKMGPIENSSQQATGHLIHYSVGVLFSYGYHLLIANRRSQNALSRGVISGLLFGLIGIATWKVVFQLHPKPPKIDLGRYMGQLLVAHLIFGLSLSFASKLTARYSNYQSCISLH